MADTADLAIGHQAEHGHTANDDEADDGQYLEQGEPELELTVVLHAAQVGQGQRQRNDKREGPEVHGGEPGMQDGRRSIGLSGITGPRTTNTANRW